MASGRLESAGNFSRPPGRDVPRNYSVSSHTNTEMPSTVQTREVPVSRGVQR